MIITRMNILESKFKLYFISIYLKDDMEINHTIRFHVGDDKQEELCIDPLRKEFYFFLNDIEFDTKDKIKQYLNKNSILDITKINIYLKKFKETNSKY